MTGFLAWFARLAAIFVSEIMAEVRRCQKIDTIPLVPRRYTSNSSPRIDCAEAASLVIIGSLEFCKLKPKFRGVVHLGVMPILNRRSRTHRSGTQHQTLVDGIHGLEHERTVGH